MLHAECIFNVINVLTIQHGTHVLFDLAQNEVWRNIYYKCGGAAGGGMSVLTTFMVFGDAA